MRASLIGMNRDLSVYICIAQVLSGVLILKEKIPININILVDK